MSRTREFCQSLFNIPAKQAWMEVLHAAFSSLGALQFPRRKSRMRTEQAGHLCSTLFVCFFSRCHCFTNYREENDLPGVADGQKHGGFLFLANPHTSQTIQGRYSGFSGQRKVKCHSEVNGVSIVSEFSSERFKEPRDVETSKYTVAAF